MTWKALGEYRGPSRAGAFIRYAARIHEEARERRTFHWYVAESLRLQGEGKYVATPWGDLLDRRPDEDAEDIVARVVEDAGLEVTHEPA